MGERQRINLVKSNLQSESGSSEGFVLVLNGGNFSWLSEKANSRVKRIDRSVVAAHFGL